MLVAEELEVRLGGAVVGTLTRTRSGARFRYTDDVIATSPGMPVLSASLPVSDKLFSPEATAAWFTGLLPEDRQRDEVQRRFGLQSGTYFDLLREIGWECAGAVTIGHHGPEHPAGLLQVSSEELGKRLAALPSHPYDETSALRVSLGGFQDKLLVAAQDDGWTLPLNGQPSTHILKPQPSDRHPALIESEAWAMAVAASVTRTAETRMLGLADAPVTLVVTRFDRRAVDGSVENVERIHQEDAAQALGIAPERKYAASGSSSRADPTLLGLARVLDRYAQDPLLERTRLLEQLTVNIALGNTDAHAKNYALLHDAPGQLRLSPMYDVVPATFVNPGQIEMGLRVDGVLRIDRVGAARIVAEARQWGMPESVATSTVVDTLEAIDRALAAASERYPKAPAGLHEHVQARTTALRAMG